MIPNDAYLTMSTPLSATIARLKPPRDKQALVLMVSCSCGNPVGNGLLLVIIFIPIFANAAFVGAGEFLCIFAF